MSLIKLFAITCLLAFVACETKANFENERWFSINWTDLIKNYNRKFVPNPSVTLDSATKSAISGNIKYIGTNGKDKYPCPSGYHYASWNEYQSKPSYFCDMSNTGGDILNYRSILRLKGGASVGGDAYGCRSKKYDGRRLAGGLCVKGKISERKIFSGNNCPSGWEPYTDYDEGNADQDAMCNLLGVGDDAMFGVHTIGRIVKNLFFGYTWCTVDLKDGYSAPAGRIGCIKRSVSDAKIVHDTSEFRCPAGYSTASVDEVLNNREAFCGKLGEWDLARLAGGASFAGSRYGCNVVMEDRRSLNNQFCVKLDAKRVAPKP